MLLYDDLPDKETMYETAAADSIKNLLLPSEQKLNRIEKYVKDNHVFQHEVLKSLDYYLICTLITKSMSLSLGHSLAHAAETAPHVYVNTNFRCLYYS